MTEPEPVEREDDPTGLDTGDSPGKVERPPRVPSGTPRITAQQLSFERSEAWSAPLPPPEAFAQYDQILPGASERILRMAERDLEAKIDQDRKVTDALIRQSSNGQAIAALLAFIALIAAIVFFALGNDVAGAVMLGMPVVLLIRSFLPGGGEARAHDDTRPHPRPAEGETPSEIPPRAT